MKYLLIIFVFFSLSLAGQTETDTTVVKESVDVNFELIMAAWRGEAEYALMLLKDSADVNTVSSDGISPLMYAVQGNYLKVVKVLVANGANINYTISGLKPALTTSVLNGFTEITDYLLWKGANVNLSDESGNTPLMLASIYGLTKEFNVLLKYGADVKMKNSSGESALWLATYSGNIDFVYRLLLAGADINSANYSGYTPLMVSAMYGDTIMMNYLMQNRADTESKNRYYQTAADVSIANSNYPAFHILTRDSVPDKKKLRSQLKSLYLNGAYGFADSIKEQFDVFYLWPVTGSVAIGYGPDITYNDALFGTFFLWNDKRYRVSARMGWATGYWRNRVEYSINNTQFQFWELRNHLYIGLEKKIRLNAATDIHRKFLYAGVQANYSMINFRGIEGHPDGKASISPYIGYGMTGKYMGCGVRYLYYPTGDSGLSPHRLGFYFTINLFQHNNEKYLTKCSMCQ